jgi:hypothetical protein
MDVGMMMLFAGYGWNGIGYGEVWTSQTENAAPAAAE